MASTPSNGDAQSKPEFRVLMVCLGNICRSPIAAALVTHLASQRPSLQNKIHIESCGTAGYHVGEKPDERSVRVLKKHGVPINSRARQLRLNDFTEFTHIIAMDEDNLRNINRIKSSKSTAQISLFSSHIRSSSKFDKSNRSLGKSVPDPYYGGLDGFEEVYRMCEEFGEGLLDELEGEVIG